MKDELSYEERDDFQVHVQRSDPSLWGLSICTVDGQRYSLGKRVFTQTFMSVKRKHLDININHNQVMWTPSSPSNPAASRSRTPSVSRNLVQRSKMMKNLVAILTILIVITIIINSILTAHHCPQVVHKYIGQEPSGRNFNEICLDKSGKSNWGIEAIKDRNLNWSKLLREAPQSNAECRSYHVLLSYASGSSFLKLCPLSATG